MTPEKSGRPGTGGTRCFSKWLKRSNFPISFFWPGRNWRLAEPKDGVLQKKYRNYPRWRINNWRPVIDFQQPGGKMENLVRNKFGTFKSIHHALTLSQR
jgi:hypothetical protein